MTARTRQYHLGCGESLFTHYNNLWQEARELGKKQKKVEQDKKKQKDRQVRD